MAESNNWSELPGELLSTIDQRLHKLEDVIRFRAICKPWRRSLMSDQHGRFTQSLPWLLVPYCSDDVDSSFPAMAAGCKGSDSCRRFYDVAEHKFRHIELPEGLDKATCRGSAFGWVFTMQRTPFMFLLNPLTRDQIRLPPITTFPDVLKYLPEKTGHEYLYITNSGRKIAQGKKFFELNYIMKMALSADPAVDKDFVVMVIRFLSGVRLAFCRPSDDEAWRLIPHLGVEPTCFMDVVFWRGQFYALDSSLRVFVCDISIPDHPRLRMVSDHKDIGIPSVNLYLLVSPTGDELMMMARYRSSRIGEDDDDDDDIVLPEDDEADAVALDDDWDGEHVHPGVVENAGVDIFVLEDDEVDVVALDVDSDDEHRVDPGVDLDSRVTYTTRFKVFKLNDDRKDRWEEVGSIGEYALFLGYNTSTFVCTREHPEIAPNSIYFTDDLSDFHYKKVLGGYDMGIFSLSTCSVEPLYDVRSLHKNPSFIYPDPVWFLPSNY